MTNLELVSQGNESTVVAEYISEGRTSQDYQSEDALEKDFIRRLVLQGYENISVEDEKGLIANLRAQLERLNDYRFSEQEWKQLFGKVIANANEGIIEKTRRMQEDHVQVLRLDNGQSKNIKLIDKKDIHNNHLQVFNQYTEKGGKHETRYDVTILVNGFPLVHVELKRRGVALKEAFNQINRYQRDSFWAGCGLFEYVQLFIISNGTNTKYYSNTTRNQHIKTTQNSGEGRKSWPKTSHSFEFTSFWADANNRTIPDLVDFSKTFFAKHTLLSILTKYCIFTVEKNLLVMRPYQIVATERILNRIELAHNHKKVGSVDAGGYIWHTTGSGKTLTSFKAAQIATALPYIDKVLFVVDRKDLDYQTMKEYDKFEKNAANSNTTTAILQSQLENDNSKIIITTIQKLAAFLKRNKKHDIYKKHIVMIFDECHRSQFGEMHKCITDSFKNYYIFGFTGTPIFAENSGGAKVVTLSTTEQAFGDKLHSYTIIDAIHDGNVLPFRIDYVSTVQTPESIRDKQVSAIDRERALADPRRIQNIVDYILEHFDAKTYRSQGATYQYSVVTNVVEMAKAKKEKIESTTTKVMIDGFNSMFAVASIPMAQQYYEVFKKRMEAKNKHLRIATIFSYAPNDDSNSSETSSSQDEDIDTSRLSKSARDFLSSAITDYNEMFATNYDTSADKFPNYYKDVSMRMKNKEIDLLIVVNMFLTGFDATTLNTLWVDKNLKYHGLIQSFSRTNRILNSIKQFGNIVCFRNLEDETNEALALFGNKEARGIVLLKSFDAYMNGYEEDGRYIRGYKELIEELLTCYPMDTEIIGEEAEKDFIRLFTNVLRLHNILRCFDDFEEQNPLSERDFADYRGKITDLHTKYKNLTGAEKERINEDIVFEMGIVASLQVNIDYILMLADKYKESQCEDKTITADIRRAIGASPDLRSKKALVESFIDDMTAHTNTIQEWMAFVQNKKDEDLAQIIADENLNDAETLNFMKNAFRDNGVKTTGTDIDAILPPMSRFGGKRALKKQAVIDKLSEFFEKYKGLGVGE